MIIVLDDTATAKATESIQTLATTLLQTSSPTGGDRISVIRLSTKSDNVAFDVQTVRTRLAGFQAGSIPFAVGQTTEELLDLITRISPELAEPKSRRKAIVCVGAPGVCSMRQRSQNIERPALWTNWVNGVTALGKNNISLYAFMPVPKAVGDGALTDFSGGTGFTTAADFTPFARQIWSELSNYYMIGYKAEPTNKDLRNISVKVSKGGMKIHARQLRGK
jgi:hypothetical protein